jgi:hypothetical protein
MKLWWERCRVNAEVLDKTMSPRRSDIVIAKIKSEPSSGR